MTTLYEQLEVAESASQEVIAASHKALARRYHPDNAKTGNAERFSGGAERVGDATRQSRPPQLRRRAGQGKNSGRRSRRARPQPLPTAPIDQMIVTALSGALLRDFGHVAGVREFVETLPGDGQSSDPADHSPGESQPAVVQTGRPRMMLRRSLGDVSGNVFSDRRCTTRRGKSAARGCPSWAVHAGAPTGQRRPARESDPARTGGRDHVQLHARHGARADAGGGDAAGRCRHLCRQLQFDSRRHTGRGDIRQQPVYSTPMWVALADRRDARGDSVREEVENMRLRPRTLGVYMPAQFNEPQNPFGLSGLAADVPAAFNEPQNPFGVSRVQ